MSEKCRIRSRHWWKRQKESYAALRRMNRPVTFVPPTFWLLRVENEFFTAGAVWRKKDNTWLCVEAAPIIKWMLGRADIGNVKIELLKRGCKWNWSPATTGTSPQQGELAHALTRDSKNTAHDQITPTDRPPEGGEGAGPGMAHRLDEVQGGLPIVTDGKLNYAPAAVSSKLGLPSVTPEDSYRQPLASGPSIFAGQEARV